MHLPITIFFRFSVAMLNYTLKLKSRHWTGNLASVETEDYMDLEDTIKKEVICVTTILVCYTIYVSIIASAFYWRGGTDAGFWAVKL